MNGMRRRDASNYVADNLPQDYDLKLVNKVADKIIEQNLLKENEMVGISYSNSRLKEIEQGKLSLKNKGGNIAPTFTTRIDTYGIAVKNNNSKGYLIAQGGDGIYTNISNKRGTVQKGMIQTLTGFNDKGVVENDLRIRKLTPRECWRLMGFDDSDFDKASQVNSNAQLYKQAGNSIVVNVLEKIFHNLLIKDNEEEEQLKLWR